MKKAEKASRLYLMWGMPNSNIDDDPAEALLPEQYYGNDLIRSFIRHCEKRKLNWAILSPKHGVWKSGEHKSGQEKHLRDATNEEKEQLIRQIDQCAGSYEKLLVYSGRSYDRTEIHRDLLSRIQNSNKISCLDSFTDVR